MEECAETCVFVVQLSHSGTKNTHLSEFDGNSIRHNCEWLTGDTHTKLALSSVI